MFQTEPVIYLQAHASDAFHYFMVAFTRLGSPTVALAAALFLFGVDRKKGFILLQIVIASAIAAELLKDLIALPRPLYVDNAIRFLDNMRPNESPFNGMGATGFWSALPQSVVDYWRADGSQHWGMPSGHVSATVAVWAGLALLTRQPAYAGVAAFMTVGVGVSRMYFGKHFLADVIGGMALAAVIVVVAWLAVIRDGRITPFMPSRKRRSRTILHELMYYAWLLLVPIAGLFLANEQSLAFAALLGLNLGHLVIGRTGLPPLPAPVLPAFLRGAVAVALIALVALGLHTLLTGDPALPQVSAALVAAPIMFVFVYTVALLSGEANRHSA
ncbi:MAG: phosphatase PAP2 family protein [Gammaproteobacteria bacterium]|nr:phosphatase PAP2 family protein [Gammaproteobacteria bacterium]